MRLAAVNRFARIGSIGSLVIVLAVIVLAVACGGCATTQSQGDDAFARGDYLGAAALYAEAAKDKPGDRGLHHRLDEARARGLDLLVSAAEQRVAANDAAGGIAAMTKLVETRASWNFEPNDATKARITKIAAWTLATIKDEIVHVRDADGALAAEAALTARAPLVKHPEFGDGARDLNAVVTSAGAENCASLTKFASPSSPYLDQLIAAYCKHFGAPPPSTPPLLELVSNLDLDAKVEGMDDDAKARLATTIDTWLRDSIWFAPEPVRIGHARLGGTLRSTYASTQVTKQENWVEHVAYQATETYQEAYPETYTTTETYTEQVPYTTTESYSATCGYGSSTYSCSQTRSVTRYQSQMRTRPVTKTRTAYRPATRIVTQYRDEPRVYTYDAVQKTGTYRSDWTAQITLGVGGSPLVVHRANTERQVGLDHDADFPPAGVRPSRAKLMTQEGWVTSAVNDLGRAFVTAANAHWKRLYCTRGVYTAEDAARCVYLRSDAYPQAAIAPLTKLFGRELAPLLGQNVKPGQAAKPEPAAKPAPIATAQ